MKKVLCGLLLVVVLSSLVMATGSEINTNFVIKEKVSVDNYVPNEGFWNNYINYIIVVLIIFVIGYFLLKVKSKKIPGKKKISKRKVRKRK